MTRRRTLAALVAALAVWPALALAQLFSPNAPTIATRDGLRVPTTTASFDFTGATLPPGVTLTRSTVGWAFNPSGVLTQYAINAPRWDYESNGALRGLWIEENATDIVRNSSAVGAVAGTPGTPPTNWTIPAVSGWTLSIVGTGTESGIPYIDLHYTGNRAGNTVHTIDVEPAPGAATVNGDLWGGLGYFSIPSSSVGGFQALRLSLTPLNAGGGALTTVTVAAQGPPGVGGTLRGGETAGAVTMADPLTASVRPRFQITVLGGDIDATVRIGLPTFFRTTSNNSGRRNSPIVTTTAAVTRAADVVTVPLANGTYAVEVVTSSAPVSNVFANQVVTTGSYVVPAVVSPVRAVNARRTGP